MDYGIYTMNRAAETMTAKMVSGFRHRLTLPVELNEQKNLKTWDAGAGN